mmetsp:Transcript_15725/g.19773  ORF Transcript_15725/g.19773 Transcript_15725/m.19773 type:complete len:201 (+) Transcript_15725:1898-2500(+)
MSEKAAIDTSREEPIIVEAEAHASDRALMSHHLHGRLLERHLPEGDRAWSALLTEAGIDDPSVCRDCHCRDYVLGVETVLLVPRVPEFAIVTRHDCSINRAWHSCNARDRNVALLEVVILASCLLSSLHLHVIESNHALIAAIAEPGVISKPINATDLATVALALVIRRAVHLVEVINVSVAILADCEQVPAIAEPHLLA